MMKALKDISKSHKKSTSTRAPIADPSLFISEKPKGKSETHVEEFKDFSDSLPIFDESDEEPIESLFSCEKNCDLPSLESKFMNDNEQTIVQLTVLQPEHPSSLVLSQQVFEEEPLDYPYQGPCLYTRNPLDEDLGPIFDEEDEPGPVFDEEATSNTSIVMESHLCFDTGTTPSPLSSELQEHCEQSNLLNSQPDMFVKISSLDVIRFGLEKFLKHNKGFGHFEKSLEIDLKQTNLCARKSFESFVFKGNDFDLSSSRHALITGDLFASSYALDEILIKKLLEPKSFGTETDFCDLVLKPDLLNVEKDMHVLRMIDIVACLDTILVYNVYFDVHLGRLKCVLLVLEKEILIFDLNMYLSCTYDSGLLVSILSVQERQVQSQRNESIALVHQPEIWSFMNLRNGTVHGYSRDDPMSSQRPRQLDDWFRLFPTLQAVEESYKESTYTIPFLRSEAVSQNPTTCPNQKHCKDHGAGYKRSGSDGSKQRRTTPHLCFWNMELEILEGNKFKTPRKFLSKFFLR
ncbi:hypothetical protein YC2023_018330 [Brassica napus]